MIPQKEVNFSDGREILFQAKFRLTRLLDKKKKQNGTFSIVEVDFNDIMVHSIDEPNGFKS